MLIDPRDGRCDCCGGPLKILDVDDQSMIVECLTCGTCAAAEPGAFGGGSMRYYLGMIDAKFGCRGCNEP